MIKLNLIYINKSLHCDFTSKPRSTSPKRKRIFHDLVMKENHLVKRQLLSWGGESNIEENLCRLWKSISVSNYLTITKIHFA